VGLVVLADSQKEEPGSIKNENFKEIKICVGWCPFFKSLDEIF